MSISTRARLAHYAPALVLAAAVPLFVALFPSEPRDRSGLGGTPSGFGAAPSTADPGGAWRILPPPEDCFRKQAGFDTCPNRFEGDNGGTTYAGVTGDTINIVYYEPQREEQVDSILGVGGAATDSADIRAVLEAFEDFANRAYEFYGRRVEITYQIGPGSTGDPAQQQADATRAAVQHNAFAVVSEAASRAFHDELSRRGVINTSLLLQFEADYYAQHAPFHWGNLPDLDLIIGHVAEYWCKRLMDQPAEHAGPGLQGQPRRLGVIHSEQNDAGARLTRAIEGCGGQVARVVQYSDDLTTATQQATSTIAQMRAAGVTTVTCICDPITPAFTTAAADAQDYNPEWLHNGYGVTDHDQAGRLYAQDQWAHSFGPSSLSFPTPIAEDSGWKAYFAVRPDGPSRPARTASYLYALFETVFGGIEAAGPNLNPQDFAAGLANPNYYPAPSAPNEVAVSFGPAGRSPFTAVDTMMEIWWDPDRTGSDGERGAAFYVRSGQRYDLDEWPAEPPDVFHDDGTPQPSRDPNR